MFLMWTFSLERHLCLLNFMRILQSANRGKLDVLAPLLEEALSSSKLRESTVGNEQASTTPTR